MISVIILTFNDEVQISNCLDSVRNLTDDIVIIDSFSTDSTKAICKKYGARFYQHNFINQAVQFNWALDNIDLKYGWVLRLDSDEVLPEALKLEMVKAINSSKQINAYYINRKMYWMGRWLRHGRMYPHYIIRLFKLHFARYEEKTEEHLIVDGAVAYLTEPFFENNLKNSLEYFTEKHLITARGEVQELLNIRTAIESISPSIFGAKVQRTRWLKEFLYNKIPLFLRPFLYFIYRYFFCLGFLDGYPGLIFHILQGFWYRFYIDAILYEFKFNNAKKYKGIKK
jgi:glycosyltransferase involved in cell wall biosynthesis